MSSNVYLHGDVASLNIPKLNNLTIYGMETEATLLQVSEQRSYYHEDTGIVLFS